MNSTSATESETSANAPLRRPPVKEQFGKWLCVLGAIGLVGLPVLVMQVPREVAQWYLAAAEEAELREDAATALRYADAALKWDPSTALVWNDRARLKLASGDLEGALADCNEALEIAQGDSPAALLQRMTALQRLGRHDEALADADALVQMVQASPQLRIRRYGLVIMTYADALNVRAYGRALANQQIKEGLQDIELALSQLPNGDDYAKLDTRGYLYYLDGQDELAKRDLERAVELAEADLEASRKAGDEGINRGIDPQRIRRDLHAMEEGLSVLLHHRGLVYERLGMADEARRDFDRAIELGYDPEQGVW